MAQRESGYARQPRDLYETPAWVTTALLDDLKDQGWQPTTHTGQLRYVWEPAAGTGAMAAAIRGAGYCVTATDIEGSCPGRNPIIPRDFLAPGDMPWQHEWIITNPPYDAPTGTALQFIERGLELIRECEGLLALLLSVDFDSGKTRRHLFGECHEFRRKLVLMDRIEWFDRKAENEAIKAENVKRKAAGLKPEKLIAGPSANHAWYIWNASPLVTRFRPLTLGYAGKPKTAKAANPAKEFALA